MDNTSIKNNIRNLRRNRSLTQEEMAHKMGMSLTSYRDFEKGETAMISPHIPHAAEILGTSVEEILLGYAPEQSDGPFLEDVRHEYGGQITILETRVEDLKKLVASLEETIKSKNEIITMLKNSLGEDK